LLKSLETIVSRDFNKEMTRNRNMSSAARVPAAILVLESFGVRPPRTGVLFVSFVWR
jgi:hypothetical protein